MSDYSIKRSQKIYNDSKVLAWAVRNPFSPCFPYRHEWIFHWSFSCCMRSFEHMYLIETTLLACRLDRRSVGDSSLRSCGYVAATSPGYLSGREEIAVNRARKSRVYLAWRYEIHAIIGSLGTVRAQPRFRSHVKSMGDFRLLQITVI